MDKKLSDGDVNNSPCLRESENDKSFVGKFKSHVSEIISNTPLSKWFRKQTDSGSTVRRRDEDFEDDELYQMQPPVKRTRLPTEADVNSYNSTVNFSETLSPITSVNNVPKKTYNSFPEPVAGPSGCGTRKILSSASTVSVNSVRNKFKSSDLLNGNKDSDSEESTSGYSSVARIGSKEQVCCSQTSSKQTSPLENSPAKSRSLFQTPTATTSRSLFTERSLSPNMNSSLSSRRPSFNASTFGSPNFVDRTLSTKRILNSPFYSGRTIYGGASAYGKGLGRSSQDLNTSLHRSIQIKPVNKTSTENGNVQLGKTARRILDTLERYSSPVSDAKKIPVASKRSKPSGMLSRYTGANPYVVRQSKAASSKELQVPTVPDLLKMKLDQQKSRLQDSTEAVRQIATLSKSALNAESYKIVTDDSEKGKSTGKIKTKISSVRHKPQLEEPASPLKLNPVALPIKALPQFELVIPPPPTVIVEKKKEVVQRETEKSSRKDMEFKFSAPLVLAENVKTIVAINNFKFSEPLCKKQPFSFKIPESKVPSPAKTKNNGETVVKTIPNMLKTGSVMDILGVGKTNSGKIVSSPVPPLMEKFKPAEGTWECPTCMIRNQPDKMKCVACETPSPKSRGSTTTKEPAVSDTKPLPGFGDKFKAPISTWECTTCMIRNNNELSKCAACETAKPGAAPAVTSSFGAKFAPPPSTWECSTCMIRNKDEVFKCLACETPRPSSSKPEPATLAEKFKMKENEWECAVCMVRNKSSSTKCQCCESTKPGAAKSVGIPQIPSEKKPISSFNFGIDKATASSFTFGIPAGSQGSAVTTAPTGESLIFGAGAKPVAAAAPANFTFGIPATQSEEKPKTTEVVPQKVATPSLPAASNPLLKANEKLPDKATPAQAGFTFGISSTTPAVPSTVTTAAATPSASNDESPAKKSKPTSTTMSSTLETPKPTFSFKPLAANGDINKSSLFDSTTDSSTNKAAVNTTLPPPASNLFNFVSKPAVTAVAVAPIAVKPAETTMSQQETSKQPMFKFGSSSNDSTALPKFGANANATEVPVNNAFGSSSAPAFGTPANAAMPAFGAQASTAEPANKVPMFSFGQSAPAPSAAPVAQPAGFSFGPSSGAFNFAGDGQTNFGTSAPPNANIFGSTPATQNNGMFNFGNATANTTNQKTGFSFGTVAVSNSTPPQAGFNFGASATNAPQTGGFNFSAAAPTGFDATAKPSFNFTAGNVTGFTATPPADGGIATNRKIRKAVRRTQR